MTGPKLDKAAYHGLAGEVVNEISPHTEADPVGLLLSYLTGFGCAIGGGPYVQVGGDRHGCRIFSVLVGETSRSRKGSSWSATRPVFEKADPGFMSRQLSGFGSGEAVIDAVRDATDDDPGPGDSRILVHEPEFSRLLRVATRDGATLSPIIRDAWDGVRLAARSRSRTSIASHAYCAVLAHVVQEELHRYLLDTEVAGGFANRFVFALVTRAQLLPRGGNLDDRVIAGLATKTQTALERARNLSGRIHRTEDAELLWEAMYAHLTKDAFGFYGAITARAEAQCLRFSVLYAALDGAVEISVDHLGAAWELWRYCDASTRVVFGPGVTGDPVADRLLDALRKAGERGLTGTQQSNLFGRHVRADHLDAARNLLEELGLAKTKVASTGGRPRIETTPCEKSEGSEKTTDLPSLSSLVSLPSQGEPDPVEYLERELAAELARIDPNDPDHGLKVAQARARASSGTGHKSP